MRALITLMICLTGCIEDPPATLDPRSAPDVGMTDVGVTDAGQLDLGDAAVAPMVDVGVGPLPVRAPLRHREAAVDCVGERPPGGMFDCDAHADEGCGCLADADCADGLNGRCTARDDRTYCVFDACMRDADCGDGRACECDRVSYVVTHNACVNGDCTVDADCGPSGYCSPSNNEAGARFGIAAYYCHTPLDTCIDDADCVTGYCAFSTERGHWACATK